MVKHLSGSAQLLAMTLKGRPASPTLILGASEAGWPRALYDLIPQATYVYADFSVFLRDKKELEGNPLPGIELHFATHHDKIENIERIVVALPKSKDAMKAAFANAARMASPETAVWVVGPKKGGIASASKLIREFLGDISESSSARHAKLLQVTDLKPKARYENRKVFDVRAFDNAIRVISIPGVFSHGRLDLGTEFLLKNLPPPDFKDALDVGCGAGIIGTALKKYRPDSRVDLIDSSAAALDASRQTLSENGFEPGNAWASDLFSHVDKKYDLIITNPPFHQGIKTNFGVTNQLIEKAARYLRKKGRLILVTNTFIDYFKILRPNYSEVTTIAQNTRFRVIEAKP